MHRRRGRRAIATPCISTARSAAPTRSSCPAWWGRQQPRASQQQCRARIGTAIRCRHVHDSTRLHALRRIRERVALTGWGVASAGCTQRVRHGRSRNAREVPSRRASDHRPSTPQRRHHMPGKPAWMLSSARSRPHRAPEALPTGSLIHPPTGEPRAPARFMTILTRILRRRPCRRAADRLYDTATGCAGATCKRPQPADYLTYLSYAIC